MWLLVWLSVTSGGNLENYNLGTFATKDECVAELSKAHVLVKGKGQAIDCLEVKIDSSYMRLRKN